MDKMEQREKNTEHKECFRYTICFPFYLEKRKEVEMWVSYWYL